MLGGRLDAASDPGSEGLVPLLLSAADVTTSPDDVSLVRGTLAPPDDATKPVESLGRTASALPLLLLHWTSFSSGLDGGVGVGMVSISSWRISRAGVREVQADVQVSWRRRHSSLMMMSQSPSNWTSNVR